MFTFVGVSLSSPCPAPAPKRAAWARGATSISSRRGTCQTLFLCENLSPFVLAGVPVGTADLVVMVIITNVPREIFEVG